MLSLWSDSVVHMSGMTAASWGDELIDARLHARTVHHIHRQVDGDVVEDDDMQFVYSNQSTTHLAVYNSPTCGFTEGTTAIYCI